MTHTENKLTETVLPIDKGQIILEPESIIIQDNEKKERLLTLAYSAMWVLYGALNVLRYLKTGDKFLLWTGLLIGVGHLVVLLLQAFRTAKPVVLLSEIKAAKLRKRFGKQFLDINLKSGKVRRIRNIAAVSQELEQYFAVKSLLAK